MKVSIRRARIRASSVFRSPASNPSSPPSPICHSPSSSSLCSFACFYQPRLPSTLTHPRFRAHPTLASNSNLPHPLVSPPRLLIQSPSLFYFAWHVFLHYPNPHSLPPTLPKPWPPQETASTTFKSLNQIPPLFSGTAICAIQALIRRSTNAKTASSRHAVVALPKPR